MSFNGGPTDPHPRSLQLQTEYDRFRTTLQESLQHLNEPFRGNTDICAALKVVRMEMGKEKAFAAVAATDQDEMMVNEPASHSGSPQPQRQWTKHSRS